MTGLPLPLLAHDQPDEELEPEILLVDADAESRAILRAMVWPLARVAEVSSGEEALHTVVSSELAAILIDVDLPDANAYDIVTKLRRNANARNVPVLFLSHTPPDWLAERRGYALGALGYLTKPVDAQALRAKLEVLLTLFRRGGELRKRERMIARQHAEILEARAALEEASASNRAKDLYLGVLGHDLRNPLGAMLMSARMMLMGESLGDKDRESVVRIARNGERMAALIRDILDYTRGQAVGGIPIAPRPTDMSDICTAMIEEVTLLHASRTIHFEQSGELRGLWDRERVEQVISNLLTNALNHGIGPIRVRAIGHADEVSISVHNRGARIPRAQLPQLFEPFRRGASSRVGLGLGLYIVNEILRVHGGSVEVQSTEDEGTTFTTRWPRTPPRTEGAPT
ncbi:MAG: hybrid sensor histidine kinase/response regulator [Myxococcota bacterium]|nr:hybrid sensor histidine kinase/response regulator [Myxococcota bacterium]